MSRNLTKSAFILTFSEIVFALSGYIIHAGTGRILGPSDYGVFAIVITLTTMVIVLLGKSIPTAMSKYISEIALTKPEYVHSMKQKTIRLQIVFIAIITLLFYFSAPLIAKLLGDETLIPFFQISALILPAFASASFYFSFYTGLHKFKTQALLKTLRALFRIILILGFAFYFGTFGAIWGYILTPILVFLVGFILDKTLYKKAPWQKKTPEENLPEKYTGKTFTKKLLIFAWPLTLFMLFYELMLHIDLYMVKRFIGSDAQTGVYNASLTIARLPYFLFYAFTIILFPTISKLASENNTTKISKLLSNVFRFQYTLLIPTAVIMILFAPSLLMFFYGEDYLYGIETLRILSIGAIFLTIFYVMSFAINGAGRVKFSMKLALVGLMLNFLLNLALIPILGLSGAAWSTVIASFLVFLLLFLYLKKDFFLVSRTKSLAKVLFASAIIGFVGFLFPQHTFLFLLWSLFLFSLYFVILFIIREITKKDVSIFFKK